MPSVTLIEPIYLRQEGESDEAFRAFEMYRDTPVTQTRRYKDVADASNLSLATVNTYGSKFRWRERALSYDRHADAERLSQINRRRVEMQERHSLIAAHMLAKVAARIAKMDAEDLTARDIKEWVDIATKVENLARGQATSITRTVVSTDEQDRLTREQLVKEAKEFFHETRMAMPNLPISQILDVVREEFDIEVEELNLALPPAPDEIVDALDAGEIG